MTDRDIARIPAADDPAFMPDDEPRWDAIRAAHRAIEPMFWGSRHSLEACCARIRDWLHAELA